MRTNILIAYRNRSVKRYDPTEHVSLVQLARDRGYADCEKGWYQRKFCGKLATAYTKGWFAALTDGKLKGTIVTWNGVPGTIITKGNNNASQR